MSKIMNFEETHYSVRQKIGDAGSISTQNIFPLHSVVLKRLESPYGAKYVFVVARKSSFPVFSNTVPAVRKDETLTRMLRFWARKLGSELTPNGII